ncbi:MAG: hypothetical protein CTY19_12905 [Methylomonas sp.]|nr:MAG: hypothetical protein CTY19_12905 [Methylomonas sp.]
MNTHKNKSFAMALLIVTSFMVNANEEYSPAEYQPAVDYSEYAGKAVSVDDLDVSNVSKPDPVITEKSVEQSVQISSATADTIEHSAINSTEATATPSVQVAASNQTQLMLIFVAVSMLGGWMFFRRTSANTTSPSRTSSAVLDSANKTTGVERYLEKIAVSKTGVDKYLDRQAERIPSTGVAKYLAKQAVRDDLKN